MRVVCRFPAAVLPSLLRCPGVMRVARRFRVVAAHPVLPTSITNQNGSPFSRTLCGELLLTRNRSGVTD